MRQDVGASSPPVMGLAWAGWRLYVACVIFCRWCACHARQTCCRVTRAMGGSVRGAGCGCTGGGIANELLFWHLQHIPLMDLVHTLAVVVSLLLRYCTNNGAGREGKGGPSWIGVHPPVSLQSVTEWTLRIIQMHHTSPLTLTASWLVQCHTIPHTPSLSLTPHTPSASTYSANC